MKTRLASLAFLLVLAAIAPAHAASSPATPDVAGPDVPPLTAPVFVATPIDHARFSCADSSNRSGIVAVPASWNRAILSATIEPSGDPWDRLYAVAIGGVEVLRGTTPRTAMTVRKDVTEFGSLLPAGGTATVTLSSGSYVGALIETVTIEFYDGDPTAALVRSPAPLVVPGVLWAGLARGVRAEAQAELPAVPPRSAIVEITLSGHGTDEDWFLSDGTFPPDFRVFVGDVEVAVARPMPYVYSPLGFGNADANTVCAAWGTSSTGDAAHPLMYWTAQRIADLAGVHTGVGEIPPYRAIVDPGNLPLLTGSRAVRIEQNGGHEYWPASFSFLLR